MFTTYVLYSVSYDKIYIGYTSDMVERLKSHNALATKGYTIKFRPWIIVYSEDFELKSDAMKREKELKSSRGRNFIREHIQLAGLKSVS
jgi:putative endonuclease